MRRVWIGIAVLAALSLAAVAFADPGVDDGLIPEPEASQTFVQLSGGGWWDGVYDYDGPHPWINLGGDPSVEDLQVSCDIELYCYEWLSASNVYFHMKGDTYAPMSAVISGQLKSNNGQYIGIADPDDTKNLNQLEGTTDGFGRDVTQAPLYAAIPVVWELSEDGGTTWRVPDTVSWGANHTVYGMWWLLAQGEPCDHDFKIRLTIQPKYHQPDGHYVLDPLVTVDPVL